MPDWLKELLEKGNQFNRENCPNYKYNEVQVKGEKKNYVVDSYNPNSEIVSRKCTQLVEVKETTAIGYINELVYKYSPGTEITDSPFNPKVLRGTKLQGEMILEVPVQVNNIPNKVINAATNNKVTIRDIKGKEYN